MKQGAFACQMCYLCNGIHANSNEVELDMNHLFINVQLIIYSVCKILVSMDLSNRKLTRQIVFSDYSTYIITQGYSIRKVI